MLPPSLSANLKFGSFSHSENYTPHPNSGSKNNCNSFTFSQKNITRFMRRYHTLEIQQTKVIRRMLLISIYDFWLEPFHTLHSNLALRSHHFLLSSPPHLYLSPTISGAQMWPKAAWKKPFWIKNSLLLSIQRVLLTLTLVLRDPPTLHLELLKSMLFQMVLLYTGP